PEVLDDELAQFALGVARQAVPAEGRGDEVPFGPPESVPEGVGPYGELAAWLGRSWDVAGAAGARG
ncbi:MAG TPA: hypothetical protein VGO89_15390, partial [Streptomyces sp.]|nr:hypothetical protein [Streptomyces sp.]